MSLCRALYVLYEGVPFEPDHMPELMMPELMDDLHGDGKYGTTVQDNLKSSCRGCRIGILTSCTVVPYFLSPSRSFISSVVIRSGMWAGLKGTPHIAHIWPCINRLWKIYYLECGARKTC